MQRESGPHYHARHPGRRMMEARKRSFDALSEASRMVVLHWGGKGRLLSLASQQQQLLASQQLQFRSLQTQLDAHSKATRMVCRQLACWGTSAASGAVLCLVMPTCRRSMACSRQGKLMLVLHLAAVVAHYCQKAAPGSAFLEHTLICSHQLALQPAAGASGFCATSLHDLGCSQTAGW